MNKEDRKDLVTENIVEDAAKAAFTKAQSVYRADHDHFPLKHTWETTFESVREGWRAIAYAAVEAAVIPPLGTQPEPRHIRALAVQEEAVAELERLRAGIKRLSDEEEKLAETTDGEEFSLVSIAAQLAAAESEIDRLRRELEEARRALEPFAEEAACYDPDDGDGDSVVWATPVYFKIRDLRHARAAIRQCAEDKP